MRVLHRLLSKFHNPRRTVQNHSAGRPDAWRAKCDSIRQPGGGFRRRLVNLFVNAVSVTFDIFKLPGIVLLVSSLNYIYHTDAGERNECVVGPGVDLPLDSCFGHAVLPTSEGPEGIRSSAGS